jgi:hypothetical protein
MKKKKVTRFCVRELWHTTYKFECKILTTNAFPKCFRTLAKLTFTHQIRKQLAKNIERVREREKTSPGWRVGLYFYSPILNSTRNWRVGEWLSAPLVCVCVCVRACVRALMCVWCVCVCVCVFDTSILKIVSTYQPFEGHACAVSVDLSHDPQHQRAPSGSEGNERSFASEMRYQ